MIAAVIAVVCFWGRVVSYRWQAAEVWICPGLTLNMSRWQMERVVDALENTSCFYVWIDRLSVPQYECELQNTLLSRMMATFASARETLVLRSIEENGSRYHQRAWCEFLHAVFNPTLLPCLFPSAHLRMGWDQNYEIALAL
jgi:hypothetical protein